MATEFILPALGDGIDGGTLVKILVKAGDAVEENQSVLELETDKAVLEVPSTVSGTIQSIAAKEGSKIKVGDPVFTVDGAASTPAPQAEAPAETPKAEAAPAQVESTPVPVGDVTDSSQAMNGDSNNGATNNASQNGSQQNGTAPQAASAAAPSTPVKTEIADRSGREPIPASPSTRRLAREIGVDVYEVQGSGPGGRIGEDDVKSHARGLLSGGIVASGVATAQAAPLPDFSKFGATVAEPLSNVRRATSNQMARAWQAPHVTQFDKADITDIEALRKKYSSQAEKRGGKLTVTAILVKVIVAALKNYPQFNASLDLAGDQIIYKKYYNVGVAVDTERGLLVPVIKDADKKGIFDIAKELGEIAERARNKKTSLDEMSGGCFTLTNLGGIGGTNFTPIINVPEVAILGVARGSYEPVWNKETGAFEPRMMLPLSLSYDHRVIDGADGARFLRFIAQSLEEPFLLALES
jgi:pyruvate dehydrogenase E2 component (dihydrolipoamide acetyltransferase)